MYMSFLQQQKYSAIDTLDEQIQKTMTKILKSLLT